MARLEENISTPALALSLSQQSLFSLLFFKLKSLISFLRQGVNSMFQVFLTGNNSEYFTISPTAVQGRADIRMRVAMPLDYEHIRSYSFSVSLQLLMSKSTGCHTGFSRKENTETI